MVASSAAKMSRVELFKTVSAVDVTNDASVLSIVRLDASRKLGSRVRRFNVTARAGVVQNRSADGRGSNVEMA